MILPKRPLSRLPFPRSPTSEEKIVLERVFRSRLLELGILPGEWERALNEHIFKWTFSSWNEILSTFEKLIKAIEKGRFIVGVPYTPSPEWLDDWNVFKGHISKMLDRGDPPNVLLEGMRKMFLDRMEEDFLSVLVRELRKRGMSDEEIARRLGESLEVVKKF